MVPDFSHVQVKKLTEPRVTPYREMARTGDRVEESTASRCRGYWRSVRSGCPILCRGSRLSTPKSPIWRSHSTRDGACAAFPDAEADRPEHGLRSLRRRQRLHGKGARRKRHLRRLDRLPHAAGRAAPRLGSGHQPRHPLAEGECARVPGPAGMDRLVGYVEWRAPGAARGDAGAQTELLGAPRPGRHRCEAGLGDLGLGRARPAPPLQPCEKGRQQGTRASARHVRADRGGARGRLAAGDAEARGEMRIAPALVFGGDKDERVRSS
jgi:hypothetical protein